MKASELREKTAEDLKQERVALLKEQFNLRMQRATGQMPKPHRFREVRRTIAQINTVLKQKAES